MDKLDKLLEKVDKQVKAKLEKLLSNLTEKQRRTLLANPKLIDELLKDIDIEAIAKQYSLEFSGIAGKVVMSYKEQFTAAQKTKVNFFVNTLKELKTDSLRAFITSNKQEFKSRLVELIINGSDKKVIKEYFAKTPFTTSQIGTLINTAESDIRRATVLSAFENDKNMRYRYSEDLIPTSSDICTWLVQNQNPEGYTLDEIQAGIITPYGTVDFGGRVPNYNCIHTWEPII